MKSSEIGATIAATVIGLGVVAGVVTLGIVCPDALKTTTVNYTSPPVIVHQPPVIRPYVVNTLGVINLPRAYQVPGAYVMYNGNRCYLRHNLDGSWCYVVNNIPYPVVWQ